MHSKAYNRKKVYRNRPIERASGCHSPHHIYNSLLRIRAINGLKCCCGLFPSETSRENLRQRGSLINIRLLQRYDKHTRKLKKNHVLDVRLNIVIVMSLKTKSGNFFCVLFRLKGKFPLLRCVHSRTMNSSFHGHLAH